MNPSRHTLPSDPLRLGFLLDCGGPDFQNRAGRQHCCTQSVCRLRNKMMTFVCDILNAVGKGAGEGRKRVVMAGPWVRSRIASSRLTEDPDPVCFVKKYEKKTHISGTAKFDQDNSFVALSSPVCNATTMFRLSRIETLFRYRKQSYPAGTEKGRWCLLIRPHIQLENTHFECFCRRAPAETFAAHVAVRYLDFPFARSLSVSLCHTHSLTHTHTHKFVD